MVTFCQELVDLVVDHAPSCDAFTLRRIALVSRSFCAAAQRILFQRITLDFEDSTKLFCRLLKESPHLRPFVKKLRVCDEAIIRRRLVQELADDASLKEILLLSSSLEEIHLQGFYDIRARNVLQAAMKHERISILRCDNVHFSHQEVVEILFQSLSTLKHFHLFHVRFKDDSDFELPPRPISVQLESLSLFVLPSYLIMGQLTYPTFDWSCLRSLKLVWDNVMDIENIVKITQSASVLEELSIITGKFVLLPTTLSPN